MAITEEFLKGLGFAWNARLNYFSRVMLEGTLSIGKTNIVYFGAYKIGRYTTQADFSALVSGFLAAKK